MDLPYSDVTVVELAEAAAGPLAGMMLADMGAEVIKVEKPGIGDVLRGYEPKKDGVGAYYLWANRNKRCISIDLKRQEGIDMVLELAAKADIFLENYTPGVVDELGVDYDAVREVNEDIIYCHVSGFGQSGPYSDRRVIDHAMQGEAGVMSVTGPSDQPAKAGFVYTDITTAMYTAFLLASAVRHREQTGEGQEIDMAMWDAQIYNLGLHGYRYLVDGEIAERMGTKYPAIVPYQAFETADEEYVNVCAITQKHWEAYCRHIIKRPDLIDDDRFETNERRVENREELDPILEKEMRRKPRDEWMDRLTEHGIPSSPINSIDEVVEHPVTEHRGLIETSEHSTLGEVELLGFPGELSNIEQTVRHAPPDHGEHSAEILGELGYDDETIAIMIEEGIVEQD